MSDLWQTLSSEHGQGHIHHTQQFVLFTKFLVIFYTSLETYEDIISCGIGRWTFDPVLAVHLTASGTGSSAVSPRHSLMIASTPMLLSSCEHPLGNMRIPGEDTGYTTEVLG